MCVRERRESWNDELMLEGEKEKKRVKLENV